MLALGDVHDIHGCYPHDKSSNIAPERLMNHGTMLLSNLDGAT